MYDVAKRLCGHGSIACTAQVFVRDYRRLMGLFEEYQHELAATNGLAIACSKGCTTCCYHWVEDVFSFEAACIAHELVREFPRADREALVHQAVHDEREMARIYEQVCREKYGEGVTLACEDENEEALQRFVQAGRPCPLLRREDGCCRVFAMRPLTCRSYVSVDAQLCRAGERGSHADNESAYIIDMPERVNVLLEELHQVHRVFEGDTALRSLVPRYMRLFTRSTPV
jgi:Fe-S-cluster containining protein